MSAATSMTSSACYSTASFPDVFLCMGHGHERGDNINDLSVVS